MTGNIQYLRTDRAIQSALLNLLDRKPFEKITVQDILDETPVSRATFYKHFHDKYEIAEKIQAEVLDTHRALLDALAQASPQQFPAVAEQISQHSREIARQLMKVRTGRVNLPAALAREAEAHYLAASGSPAISLEARIYAAATTAMMIALLDGSQPFPAEDAFDSVMNVCLRLMGLPDDPEVKDAIIRRRQQKL